MDNQFRRRSKRQEEHDKRQGKARRRIELLQDLKRLGLDPFKEVSLVY